MPAEFEMDVTRVVEWAVEIADRRGAVRAARIVECERPHHPGVDCVCGWLDDPPMPLPDVVETG